MEWIIMNCDGLKGLCSSLGDKVQGRYDAADDCYDTLKTLLDNLQEEDPVDRQTRRQLAASHLIQQDLVPLLIDLEDDPEVFHLGICLLVSLTQPVECLQNSGGGQNNQGDPPWVWDVNSMLMEAKTACSDVKFIKAVFSEIQKILEDAGEYDLVEVDCESINQCLLMIRNLLYIQDAPQGPECLSSIHMVFLRNLFQCGIDKLLLFLLNSKQKNFWGVTLVQLISLLYRDLVSEIFVRIEDMSSCGEESCDSSNCSHCEAAMDRPFPFDPSFRRSPTRNSSIDSSEDVSPDFNKKTVSCATETKTIMLSEQNDLDERTTSPLSQCFFHSCQIGQDSEYSGKQEDTVTTDSCTHCIENQDATKVDSVLASCSAGTLKTVDEKLNLKSASEDNKSMDSNSSNSSLDELGSHLTEFTFNFLQNGFSNLVNVLKQSLMSHSDGVIPQALDDSYFLWSVAFFLKFARRKEIEFKKIKNVFTEEVFGFLVFEAISNGEDVLNSYRNNKSYALSMRRLHLSVSALRELIKTLTFHRERGLEQADLEYLDELQRNLADMTDLRQVFLWLVRMYQPGCHNILFLRDVIVTNHYFLLLLEEWIGRGMCRDKRVEMLGHVRQFAEVGVMQKYGYLLQNFVRNDHHVNNCIFTMMHHVAGDCQKPEALLQADILKTFLEIWDTEIPITQEMNDLMEYVTHKFLSTAEENPLSCAMQLFTDSPDSQEDMNVDRDDSDDSDDDEWTEEETDKIFMMYAELEGRSDMVDKITIMFSEIGIRKSKLEVVNHMVKMGWLNSEQMNACVDTTKHEFNIETPKLNIEDKKQKRMIAVLEELSRMEEEKVGPYCVQKLKEEGFKPQLNFIQASLLEAAYVKIDDQYMEKMYTEEPVFKYFLAKGKDLPIVFYNEGQEKIHDNVYMLALLQQMGLRLGEETGLVYPRIPSTMTVLELVEAAKMIGTIDTEHVKFEIERASENITMTTKDIFVEPNFNSDENRRRSSTKVPSVAWMNLVSNYNHREMKSLYATSAALDMDTE